MSETDTTRANRAEQGAEEDRQGQVITDLDEEETEDSLTFSNGVIEKIVALSLRDVPGLVGLRGGILDRVRDVFGMHDARQGVSVEVAPDSSVRVTISVIMEYGTYAPQLFQDVKKATVSGIVGMTGLDVSGVNLWIDDVLTPEEIAERQRRLPEAEATRELPESVADVMPATGVTVTVGVA